MKNIDDKILLKLFMLFIFFVGAIILGWQYYINLVEGTNLINNLINISFFISVMSLIAIYYFVPISRLGSWAKNEYEILLRKEEKGILTKQEEDSLAYDRLYDVINSKAWRLFKIAIIGLFLGLSIKGIQFLLKIFG
ncbi:MAG: hypothetical protein Q8M43_01980 [Sulfuricurvum sp.]|uniref:hypothetical protein n=1 Tax=Sulfuricurvum sp. TaxID=2025608 RepID=UPI00273632FD|nr:hypothetical protein [Sulfuricurvum sp.]MDP3290778.1 hypothetical protein [Sulfuricurvum sp.]